MDFAPRNGSKNWIHFQYLLQLPPKRLLQLLNRLIELLLRNSWQFSSRFRSSFFFLKKTFIQDLVVDQEKHGRCNSMRSSLRKLNTHEFLRNNRNYLYTMSPCQLEGPYLELFFATSRTRSRGADERRGVTLSPTSRSTSCIKMIHEGSLYAICEWVDAEYLDRRGYLYHDR